MNLSTFHGALRTHPDLNLAILLPGGRNVPAHFHITEVGRTEKRFVDCGGTVRDLAFASVQVWVADDVDHRLPAGKLAAILDQAAGVLGKDDPDMQVECQAGTIGLFAITEAAADGGNLVFHLAPKQTACLAMDVCLPGSGTEESSCGGGNGCCG